MTGKGTLKGIAALGISLWIVAPAAAQDRDAAADRIDRDSESVEEPRQANMIEGGAPETVKVNFIVSAPILWTNNAGSEDEGQDASLYTTPSAEIRASREFADIKLEARATVTSSIYSAADENDLSFFQLRLELSAREPIHGFQPYVRYQPRIIYSDATLGTYLRTTHDFTLGLLHNFKPDSLRIYATRRESTTEASERWQVGGQLRIERPLIEQVNWAFTQSLEGRFFTGGTSDGRSDFNAISDLAVTWKPDNRVTLEIAKVAVELNSSDTAMRDYFVMTVGASLAFTF